MLDFTLTSTTTSSPHNVPKYLYIMMHPCKRDPHIVLDGGALEVSRSLGIEQVLISISHCRAYATAYAIALGPSAPDRSEESV